MGTRLILISALTYTSSSCRTTANTLMPTPNLLYQTWHLSDELEVIQSAPSLTFSPDITKWIKTIREMLQSFKISQILI